MRAASRLRLLPLLPLVVGPRGFFSFSAAAAMRATRGDGRGGAGLVFAPAEPHDSVIVFLHGLGDTAQGWSFLPQQLGLARTKFILPTAPTTPITINGGMPMPGWSDIRGLSGDAPEDRRGFDASAARVRDIIQAEVDAGIPPARIILGGFSQGGAVALHTGMRLSTTLGGIMAMSTWLPFRAEYSGEDSPLTAEARRIPLLMMHGDADEIVQLSWGRGSHDILRPLLDSSEFLTYSDMGHGGPDPMPDMLHFCTRVLADSEA